MANTTDVVSAIRELTNTKQLDRGELLDLLKDGLHAALVKRYGPNVRAEIGIDELKGTIRIVVLRTVVETVEDPGSQVSLEEARFEDPEFQVGDVLEEEVPFEVFGRTAVQAAKQRIIQRVREGERARIVAVPDEETVMLERQGEAPRPYRLAAIRDARLAVDW